MKYQIPEITVIVPANQDILTASELTVSDGEMSIGFDAFKIN